MRFHILGLPHTKTIKEYSTCAYTQKVYKLCQMLTENGHTVYHYGCGGSNPICTETIDVMTEKQHTDKFGDAYKNEHTFDITDDFHKEWYKNCASSVDKNLELKDFILCMWGSGVADVLNLIPDLYKRAMVVEPGIGYHVIESGLGPEVHKIYESYNWMAYNYGRICHPHGGDNQLYVPRNYDAVIPNYWDPKDFIFKEKKEDFYVYFGRVIERKGIWVAAEVCKTAGVKLIVAGQDNRQYHSMESDDNIEYIGYVSNEKRADLLSRARAVFVPTQYFEPFGGVAVEAQMCGTPVLASDFGVFNETVLHGITGYRCRSLDQYLWAMERVGDLDPHTIRKWAVDNFSLQRVSEMYDEYFSMLHTLWGEGWYTIRDNVDGDWLKKEYPNSALPKFVPIGNIVNKESQSLFNLDVNKICKDKKGISFCAPVKNEGKTIGYALDSLHSFMKNRGIPYEVVILNNNSTDNTKEEALKRKCKVIDYPFDVARPGLEQYLTPVSSVHSFTWMKNYILNHCDYRHICQWDMDFIGNKPFFDELLENYNKYDVIRFGAANLIGDKINKEPYMWDSLNFPLVYYSEHCWATKPLRQVQESKDVNIYETTNNILHLNYEKEWHTSEPWWEISDIKTDIDTKALKKEYNKICSRLKGDYKLTTSGSGEQSDVLSKQLKYKEEWIPALKQFFKFKHNL